MKLPSNVIQFASGNEAPYKMFKDYWNHYRSINGDKKYEYETTKADGSAISFSEKEEAMNQALQREVMRVSGISNLNTLPLASWASNPTLVWATYAVVGAMIDSVLPETIIDSIGLYSDVRTGGYGDSFSFDIKPRDLFVVTKAGKGNRTSEIHKQFNGQVTVLPTFRELTVGVSLYRVLAGKESLADFAAKAIRSMEAELAKDAFNTFNTAMGNLPTTPANEVLRVAGYTQADLVTLCQKVTAWNGGAKALIVGTQLALQNILPANANYRYEIDSEFVKIGYIRTAFGYDVMALPQVADWNTPYTLALDDKKIYVVSPATSKLVKVCLEGSTISNATAPFQNADLSQTATIMKSWGCAVATSSIAAVITLP